MNKEHEIEKLKSDLETLVKDCKQIFGSFKETLKDEVNQKKEEFKTHLDGVKNKLSEETSNTTVLKYLTVAFVAGIVVGSLIKSKKKGE